MTNGFIQLHRRLIEWEWYTDQKTFKLFLHCLLRANHKPNNWRGHHIKRGQFITSLKKLSEETGLTVKQVRLALDNLILTKELGKETTSQNTIITVLSYDIYQDNGKQKDKPTAQEGQTNGKQRATNNNDNKENNENNEIKYRAFAHLSLSLVEFEKLNVKWSKKQIDDTLDSIENYKKKTSYVSLYLTCKRWLEKEYPNGKVSNIVKPNIN